MFTTNVLVLALLSAPIILAQLSSGSGLVGLGRTLFEPDCCYACLSSFWSLELSCSQPSGRVFSINTPQCHAANKPYLTSLAYCMQQECSTDGVAVTQIEQCWNEVAGDGDPVSSYESNLPNSPPSVALAYNATSLNETVLVNDTYYLHTRDTLAAYSNQERYHALYSTLILTSVVGFCILLGLVRRAQINSLRIHILPRFIHATLNKFLLWPALFGKRHSQKLPYSLGYIPQRRTALLIAIYIVLNIVFCAISYPLSANDTWYLGNTKQLMGYVANRLGMLSIGNIALTVMFSGRNTELLYITGASRTDLITFHRWTARVASIEGLIHSAIYLSMTNQYGANFFTPAGAIHYLQCRSSYWQLGVAALLVLIMILTFSILPIRTYWYEGFVLVHIVLVIIVLVALRYHLVLRFNGLYGYEVWLYITIAVWAFDRMMRAYRIAWLNWGMILGRTPAANVELLPGNEFVRVTVWPSGRWHITPGQYCFVYFPTLPLYFESHPFSIACWSKGTDVTTTSSSHLTSRQPRSEFPSDAPSGINLQMLPYGSTTPGRTSSIRTDLSSSVLHGSNKHSISFIIRPESGLTRRLQSRLLLQRRSLSLPVLIEGPYGHTLTDIKEADIILAFAGGIGITCILGYLTAYMSSFPDNLGEIEPVRRLKKQTQRMKIFWAVREQSLVEAFKSQLPSEELLTERNVALAISCRDNGDPRLNCSEALRQGLQSTRANQKLTVLICGPGRMADEIRSCVVESSGPEYARVQLVEESFAW